MWATILSLISGVLTKAVVGYFSNKSHESSIHKLMTTNSEFERLKLLQKEYDKPDWSARITRIFIVIPVVFVFLYLCWHIVIHNPDLHYTIQTDRVMSPFWQFFLPFPINKQGIITINAVFVVERLWLATFYIIGFYLNKFGK